MCATRKVNTFLIWYEESDHFAGYGTQKVSTFCDMVHGKWIEFREISAKSWQKSKIFQRGLSIQGMNRLQKSQATVPITHVNYSVLKQNMYNISTLPLLLPFGLYMCSKETLGSDCVGTNCTYVVKRTVWYFRLLVYSSNCPVVPEWFLTLIFCEFGEVNEFWRFKMCVLRWGIKC